MKRKTYLRNQTIYQIYARNHTAEGTFVALIKDLPRIKELGEMCIRDRAVTSKSRLFLIGNNEHDTLTKTIEIPIAISGFRDGFNLVVNVFSN